MSDKGKLFVGGLAGDTSEEMLKGHFGNYGKVAAVIVNSRDYGFIAFADPTIAEQVLEDEHVINGKRVDVKRFIKDGGGGGGGGNVWTNQIYVGGLALTVTEYELCQYFQNYGVVTESVIIRDKKTLGSRGFGFVSYENEYAVNRVLDETFHELNGRLMDVRPAHPHSSGAKSGSYDGRMNANRHDTQPQTAGDGYPSYSSSGYGMPCYQYCFGGHGGPSGAQGNLSAHTGGNAGYGSASHGGPSGAQGNPSSRTGGNAGYGSASFWNTKPLTITSAGSYDGRIETNRYCEPRQTAAGGYLSYGSLGYGMPRYPPMAPRSTGNNQAPNANDDAQSRQA